MTLVLKFEPKTIEHLGVKMYSTLPAALAEIISNSYDADASEVEVKLHEKSGTPISIMVEDDGCGMSLGDIQDKFLSIGRNRREDEGDKPSPNYRRLPMGKKGLGKLALFGIAKQIVIDTIKDKKRNKFILDWDRLYSSTGQYNPKVEIENEDTENKDGTTIHLKGLKRKSRFDMEALADSLSRIFIIEKDFQITLSRLGDDKTKSIAIKDNRRFAQIEKQFSWRKDDLEIDEYKYANDIDFELITAQKPISPNSGLRGITIFSRGKLVNAPEFFSDSTSSHFFSYLTGWIKADFIDLLEEDLISTNRQSLDWEHEEMIAFRKWLQDLISKVKSDWSEKRKKQKETDFEDRTGINKEKWMSTLPDEVKDAAEKIIGTLSKDEGVDESFNPVIQALHMILPEYPELHWRHLHKKIRERIKIYYKNEQFAEAADQGTKIYAQAIRELSGGKEDGTDLAKYFSTGKKDSPTVPKIEVANINTDSGFNIQQGQDHMTRGLMAGFRNPMNHKPFDILVPGTFSRLDCLNILSLVSYLTTRLDYANGDPGAGSE